MWHKASSAHACAAHVLSLASSTSSTSSTSSYMATLGLDHPFISGYDKTSSSASFSLPLRIIPWNRSSIFSLILWLQNHWSSSSTRVPGLFWQSLCQLSHYHNGSSWYARAACSLSSSLLGSIFHLLAQMYKLVFTWYVSLWSLSCSIQALDTQFIVVYNNVKPIFPLLVSRSFMQSSALLAMLACTHGHNLHPS